MGTQGRLNCDHIPVETIEVAAYTIPTDQPESDGTLKWDSTTIVIVHAKAGGKRGLGYSYTSSAAASLIRDKLAAVVEGGNALSPEATWQKMIHGIRNLGRPGITSNAIAAMDVSLWDLKAKLLHLPLVTLLGQVRESVEVYGSGGFTSYTIEQLQHQLGGWVSAGIAQVKMKVGRQPDKDAMRVAKVREAIGEEAALFTDANGGYGRKQALEFAEIFSSYGVSWFEEPRPSDDLKGLHLLRDRGPAGMDITAGEYGYDLRYFRRMLEADAVDVLMADGTRCAGITGFMKVSALCEAREMPLSAHTAPALHLHPCCALAPVRHVEYFHDHVRIEQMLFDGAQKPKEGRLYPDLSRPGLGLELKKADAAQYAVAF